MRRALSATGPPEPSSSDTIVTNATHLRHILLVASSVSLRLEGHIALGGSGCAGLCELLPWIDNNYRVTLWSDGNATLDAQGQGRIFVVRTAPLALASHAGPLSLPLTRAPLPSDSCGIAGGKWRAATTGEHPPHGRLR